MNKYQNANAEMRKEETQHKFVGKLELNTPLSIDEIDFRVQSINKGGYATILAYKDARVDMNRLDSVYGVGFWQKKYELINGSLFCSVGIWNKQIEQWIWLQDVGTESMTEKEKGQASDAFKRACFNLGIGRELYDYPIINLKLFADEYKIEQYGGKDIVKPTFNFKLKEWSWYSKFDGNKIKFLGAIDQNGIKRFVFGKETEEFANAQKTQLKPETEQVKIGIDADLVTKLGKCQSIDELSMLYSTRENWTNAEKTLFSNRKKSLK